VSCPSLVSAARLQGTRTAPRDRSCSNAATPPQPQALTIAQMPPIAPAATGEAPRPSLPPGERYLADYPSLQQLVLLVGCGGAPVLDFPEATGRASEGGVVATARASAAARTVQKLLRLASADPGDATTDPAAPGAGSAAAPGTGPAPRLTSLELRLAPSVWSWLHAAAPNAAPAPSPAAGAGAQLGPAPPTALFLAQLAAAQPALEGLALMVATAAAPTQCDSSPGSWAAADAASTAAPALTVGSGRPLRLLVHGFFRQGPTP
jgi:hypothetical protein